MKSKRHKLILTDGTVIVLDAKPSTDEVRKLIGWNHIDYVILNRRLDIIMLVDDTGMIDGKPVNEKATALYWKRCKPGTTYQIHGHVVIINDRADV
jgi:hypothetical protein